MDTSKRRLDMDKMALLLGTASVACAFALPGAGIERLTALPGFWLAAAALACSGLARSLPWQNALAIAAIIGGASCVTGWIRDPGASALSLAQAGLLDLTVMLSSRGTAGLVLRDRRSHPAYGLMLIGLATALGTSLNALLFHAAGPGVGRLFSGPGPVLLDAGYIGMLLIVTTPWFLRKRPTPAPLVFHSAGIWLGIDVLCALQLLEREQWAGLLFAVALGGIVAIATFVFHEPHRSSRREETQTHRAREHQSLVTSAATRSGPRARPIRGGPSSP